MLAVLIRWPSVISSESLLKQLYKDVPVSSLFGSVLTTYEGHCLGFSHVTAKARLRSSIPSHWINFSQDLFGLSLAGLFTFFPPRLASCRGKALLPRFTSVAADFWMRWLNLITLPLTGSQRFPL